VLEMAKPNRVINQTELESLLKNFQEALKTYSLKDLNIAILSALNEKNNDSQASEHVLKAVASVYLISVKDLISSRARGKIQEARMVAYAILHFDMQLSMRFISSIVFKKKHHGAIAQSLIVFKQLNPEKFSMDRETHNRYKEVQNITLKHLINRDKI